MKKKDYSNFEYIALSLGCGDGKEMEDLYRGENSLVIGIEPKKDYFKEAKKTASDLEKKISGSRFVVLNQDPTSPMPELEYRVDLIQVAFPYGATFKKLSENEDYMNQLLSYLKPGCELRFIIHNPQAFEVYEIKEYNSLIINAHELVNRGLARIEISQIPLKKINTAWTRNFTFNYALPGEADIIRLYKR